MVVVDVEVAARDELEIEAGVEDGKDEQVVEEADARSHARRPRPSRSSESRMRRLRRHARDEGRAGRRRLGRRAERREHDVVLARSAQRDPDALAEDADDEPLRLEALAERRVAGNEDEVGGGRRALVTRCQQRAAHPTPLSDRLLHVETRVAERGGGDRRSRPAHVGRRAAQLELGGDLRARDRVADPQRGEAERLRERPEHDHVRMLLDQRHRALPAVLEVGLVDDDCGARVLARELGDPALLEELARGVVRVTDPDHVRAAGLGDDLGALDLAREAVERVRGRRDRGRAAGREVGRAQTAIRSSAPAPTTICSAVTPQ